MEHGNTQAIKINKTWYELDLFCGDDRILNHTQSLRISTLSISDHRAKQIVLHLPPTSGQSARAKALRIQDAQVSNRPSYRSHKKGFFHDFPTKTSMFDTKTGYIFSLATRCGHHHCLRCHQRHRPRRQSGIGWNRNGAMGGWMAG